MPWTTPKSWSTNDTLTSADMNTYVRDNTATLGVPPSASVYRSAVVSVADSTATTLSANSETYDNDTMWDAGDPSKLTATTAGKYLFIASVGFTADSDGNRQVSFQKNGSTDILGQLVASSGSTNSTGVVAARVISLSAGDYVTCRVRHTAGAALDVDFQEFSAVLISH